MSAFSDILKNYVHEKNVNVSSLASYCETDRSTFYKFIIGKREPASTELVEKIASFIKLTPLETHQLREAWKWPASEKLLIIPAKVLSIF